MQILIATPLDVTQSGGPAQYARRLSEEFIQMGHPTEVCAFSKYLRYISGIRHVLFFFHIFKRMKHVDAVVVLDTFSVALPTVCAAYVRKKKVVVRVGGDFVWEQYVNRTGDLVALSRFYKKTIRLSFKEKIAFWLQKYIVLRCTTILVFSTQWQKEIWNEPYGLSRRTTRVVENTYRHARSGAVKEVSQDIVWVGRDIPLKNIQTLRNAVSAIRTEFREATLKEYSNISHDEVLRHLQNARVLVIPSVSEVSPNLSLEALAHGVPVILTNDCGLHHMLDGVVTWINPLDEKSIEMALVNHFDEEEYLHIVERVKQFTPTRTYADVAHDFITHIHTYTP